MSSNSVVRKATPRLMDGAMGTALWSTGVPRDACLELLNEQDPDRLLSLHRAYVEAGAGTLTTNTFGANRLRLESRGLEGQVKTLNRSAVRLARQAARGDVKVFASIGPLGPGGQALPEGKRIDLFLEQAASLEEEGPDGYQIETMTSLEEACAAVRAVRRISKRLTLAFLTFPKGTPLPADLSRAGDQLREAGADVVGVNCGKGPKEVLEILRLWRAVDPGPMAARPAAGLYPQALSPEHFAPIVRESAGLGIDWIGGCCGTTPAHIAALKIQTCLPEIL